MAAEPASHLLFTYGTLMLTTGIAAVDEAMRRAGASLERAYVHGALFDLGDYPGAVPAAAGARDEDAPKVWGHLLRLDDPAALFAVLDPYEGFVAGDPAASEFVRAEAPVILAGSGTERVGQIYWYNLPVTGRTRIEGGDYLAHWAARGRPRQARLPQEPPRSRRARP